MNTRDLVPVVTNPFALMDALDDQSIVARLEGRVSDAWVYTVRDEAGKLRDGLSADGVEEAARLLSTTQNEIIREHDVRIESENDLEARFVASASRYRIHVIEQTGEYKEIRLDSAVRGKLQQKTYQPKDGGSRRPDPFWYEKGLTKACRNAKMALLPESLIALLIEKARKVGKTKTAEPTARTSSPANGSAAATDLPADPLKDVFHIRKKIKTLAGEDAMKTAWQGAAHAAGIDNGVQLYQSSKKPLQDGKRLATNDEIAALWRALRAALTKIEESRGVEARFMEVVNMRAEYLGIAAEVLRDFALVNIEVGSVSEITEKTLGEAMRIVREYDPVVDGAPAPAAA